MTLAQICENLHPWDECRIINKEAAELSVIALTRCGKAAALWLIQHDPSYLERVEEAEERSPYSNLATNRERLLYQPGVSPYLPVDGLSAVQVGETKYHITGSTEIPVRSEDWETVLRLSDFLRAGWMPGALLHSNMETLFLSKYDLQGDFVALPSDDTIILMPQDKLDEVKFSCDYTLLFDTENELQPISPVNGKTAWLIRAEWFDPWKHLEDTLSHPQITKQFTPKELEQHRCRIEEEYAGFCPRGMALPVVIYEADQDVSLYFYERSWLNAPPKSNSSAFAVIGLFKGEKRVGPHGLPLHGVTLSELALNPRETKQLSFGMAKWICCRPQPALPLH